LEDNAEQQRFGLTLAQEWSLKMAVFWAIVLMMETASTSETSVDFYQITRRKNP
jgi:hypothetical protein